MSELFSPLVSPSPEFAYRHKLNQEGRESLAHILLMPEHNIAGFIYPTVLGTGVAKSTACFFSPDFPEQIIEAIEGPVADDMNFGDWRHGPLHMEVIDPMKAVNISWHGERIRFQGAFTATHPAYAFSSHPRGNPPYFGDDRTEQHGRVVADLELDDRILHHEGFLVRDHSWGPRVWGLNQHYKWIHATTGESSLHFFEMQGFGRTELRGFLFKDGEMRHLDRVNYEFVYGDDMLQKTFDLTATDTAGRKSNIQFSMFGMLTSSHDPKTLINTGCATIDFDGSAGVGVCEFSWNKDYFDFAKTFVRKFG